MSVDAGLVRQLAELLDETGLSEIEVEDNGRRIRVARQMTGYAAPVVNAAAPVAAPVTPPSGEVDAKAHPGAVKSPMVGTAYLTSEPGAAPFVSVGDTISAGDTLLIVEAMKVMNPIVAPRSGRITQICVDNEQPVEFDQVLAIIE